MMFAEIILVVIFAFALTFAFVGFWKNSKL
jgi:hypothetical protein